MAGRPLGERGQHRTLMRDFRAFHCMSRMGQIPVETEYNLTVTPSAAR